MQTRLDFVSLQVRDLEVARQFYVQMLGFQEAGPRPGAAVFQDAAGAIFAVRVPFSDTDMSAPLGVGVSLWFTVTDPDDLHARLQAQGLQVTALQDGPFGRVFTLTDPDGYRISLHGKPGQA
ncbi:putative enzyme related to lactoylglutathione lyase [Deinobacterium chartae]|uniref:Putative enzyme related to lactoylglutathione lyase n=1 Tax=Deinobacterium chartae TaxID=521158 RepID=A0A841I1E5_9DEIO|nr:VOC family protein [Deinobacterium chartae]MBB6099631.1 putative enzyme related to lactoylglutathione lyase [Deinobacterium chartae]